MESQPQNPEFRNNPENLSLNVQMSLDRLKINQRSYYDLPNSAF